MERIGCLLIMADRSCDHTHIQLVHKTITLESRNTNEEYKKC